MCRVSRRCMSGANGALAVSVGNLEKKFFQGTTGEQVASASGSGSVSVGRTEFSSSVRVSRAETLKVVIEQRIPVEPNRLIKLFEQEKNDEVFVSGILYLKKLSPKSVDNLNRFVENLLIPRMSSNPDFILKILNNENESIELFKELEKLLISNICEANVTKILKTQTLISCITSCMYFKLKNPLGVCIREFLSRLNHTGSHFYIGDKELNIKCFFDSVLRASKDMDNEFNSHLSSYDNWTLEGIKSMVKVVSEYDGENNQKSLVCKILMNFLKSTNVDPFALIDTFEQLCSAKTKKNESIAVFMHYMLHSLNTLDKETIAENISISQVSSLITAFSSWGFRTSLYNKLGDTVVEKKESLTTSGWLNLLKGFVEASWYHSDFIDLVCQIMREPSFVKGLSTMDVTTLATCLARSHYYDFDIYEAIGEVLVERFDTFFLDIRDISPLVWSFANAYHINIKLFDMAYNKLISVIGSESLNATQISTSISLISLCWSFVVANYHKTNAATFPAILDYAFFQKNTTQRIGFKRLHQIADACFWETPELPSRCQYYDIMVSFCNQTVSPQLRHLCGNLRYDKDAEMLRTRTMDEIASILINQFGYANTVTNVEPGPYSPYMVDVCFEYDNKLGIFVQGRDKSLRQGKAGHWLYQNTGMANLHTRMLNQRGWIIASINSSVWLHLTNIERNKHVLEKVQECTAKLL